ncbi:MULTISPECIES: amidohydrolase family protein [unclassified Sphingomonas]|uniref:N-acyl-D-amino-acid deacylase family protein n=1 Tax=Sphingomonas TaxID=13687 RepID=UPI000963104C|nr:MULTISPECIES: D-aminoacylase [unclassified Sphingomonas]MBN8811416.1 D-aminoacylase [Sphingomonas sp.]OJY49689.1 MAG: D-aminoacylase [Sphingomonas sp. 67-41]
MIDLAIRGALVIDGTGAAGTVADVAVEGDRIVAIGGNIGAAREEIDAAGLTLAPGFIDAHTHDDRLILGGADAMLCKLSQGVTTVIVGNCGISLAPVAFDSRPPAPLDLLGDARWWRFPSFAAYAGQLAEAPPAVNALALVGHMPLRVEAMGGDTGRAATAAEVGRMAARLAEALEQGGAGLSTGLWYAPGSGAEMDELVALARCAAARNGLYVTHLRDEGNAVEAAVAEAIDIGVSGGLPIVISHHKCTAPENFGKSRATLAMIDACAAHHPIGLDVYPYCASSTVLRPEWVRPDIETVVSWSVPHPDRAGQSLAAIAAEWRVPLQAAAARLVPAGAVYFSMDEDEVRRIMAHRLAMIGSDGLPHDERPHPRLWGTFPRVLGHYARDLGLFPIETAVHKMTGLTADTFGIAGRGIVAAGAYADLTLFDASRIIDRADFAAPTRLSAGVVATWVNGRLAYSEAKGATGDCAGRLLRRGS